MRCSALGWGMIWILGSSAVESVRAQEATEETSTKSADPNDAGLKGVQEEIIVEGQSTSESTLKLPATLHETPRALTVIESERIREQNFRLVNDAFAYTPGITVNSFRTGGYHFYARGYRMLPDDTRVDGFVGLNAGGRYGASLFGVEQAVMLKGPAGLLYGSTSSPGGLINLVTKKPLEAAMTRLDLRTGGYSGSGVGLGERGSFGVDVDSTGPLTKNGRILYRALATVENMSYFTADVRDKNQYANASLTFKLDEAGTTTLTPMFQWTRFDRPAGGGLVVSPSTSLLTNDQVNGPIHEDDLSPLDVNLSAGGGVDEILQSGFELRSIVSSSFRVNAAYRFVANDTDIDQYAPQITSAAQRELLVTQNLVQRVQSRSQTERRYHNIDVNASYEMRNSSSWKNLTQVGVNSRFASTRATALQGPAPAAQSPINIYTGQAPELVDNHPEIAFGDWSDTTTWNAFIQNRTSLLEDRVVVTLGLGYGESRPQDVPARKSDLMPNAAIVFNASKDLALFGSYSNSFNPADTEAEDAQGRRDTFGPTLGRNFEAGAKYDLPNRQASVSLSFFQNQVDNALVQSATTDLNPNGNRYFVEAGTRKARGVELSADLMPVSNWHLTGSVSYLDAYYTGEGPASAQATLPIPDSRAEKSPEWSTSLWSRYDWTAGALNRLGLGFGFVWQAERLGGNGARTPTAPDPLVLPAFTRIDAALFYRISSQIDLALNCENLLDETIFVSGTIGSSLEIAAPRSLSLRMGYQF